MWTCCMTMIAVVADVALAAVDVRTSVCELRARPSAHVCELWMKRTQEQTTTSRADSKNGKPQTTTQTTTQSAKTATPATQTATSHTIAKHTATLQTAT